MNRYIVSGHGWTSKQIASSLRVAMARGLQGIIKSAGLKDKDKVTITAEYLCKAKKEFYCPGLPDLGTFESREAAKAAHPDRNFDYRWIDDNG